MKIDLSLFEKAIASLEEVLQLEKTPIIPGVELSQADILLMSSDDIYQGLDQFDYYVDPTIGHTNFSSKDK